MNDGGERVSCYWGAGSAEPAISGGCYTARASTWRAAPSSVSCAAKGFVASGGASSSSRPAPDQAAVRPHRVQRQFTAQRPNQFWVVDFTYVAPRSGMTVTAFVTDVFSRRIGGWRTTNRMSTELPLEALEMALWVRDRAGQAVDAFALNTRPRKSLGWMTPAEALNEQLLLRQQAGVASTG
jgi:hypothetical protein